MDVSAFGVVHKASHRDYYLTPRPTSPTERRKSRAQGAARGGVGAAVLSGGLTAGMNGSLKGAGAAAALGGAAGGVLGATGKHHKTKLDWVKRPQ